MTWACFLQAWQARRTAHRRMLPMTGSLPDRALDRAYRFPDAPPNGRRIPLTMAHQFRRPRVGLRYGALTVLLNHASSSPQNICVGGGVPWHRCPHRYFIWYVINRTLLERAAHCHE